MIYRTPPLPDDFLQVIEKINGLREKLRFATSDSLNRWTRLLARTTAAQVMVSTNSIEGINVTLDHAIAVVDGEPSPGPEDADRRAVIGYWNAMTYIVQLSKDPGYVHNEGTLKSLHYMLLAHDLKMHPGRWRPGAIHIANTASNQIVYEGPDAALVPGLMAALIDFLNTKHPQPLVKAALAHLNLTMIHPFSDGNGRMARALQTMVLSREGILDPHFSSIEEYIGAHSADYYQVLAEVGRGSWQPGNDPLPWIRFCLTAHYRQAAHLLRRIMDTAALWNALESEIKSRKMNPRVIHALADAATGLEVRNPVYRKQAEISNQVAKTDLKNLADAGLLTPKGEKRGRHYLAGATIKEIRDRTRTAKMEANPFLDVRQSAGAR